MILDLFWMAQNIEVNEHKQPIMVLKMQLCGFCRRELDLPQYTQQSSSFPK